MEIDLELHHARSATFRSEVCIVGAGIAGLTLAHRLDQQGIHVALLEAGSRKLDDAEHGSFGPVQLSGETHRGMTEGRFRVYGGTSLGWGGQLLPLHSANGAPDRPGRPQLQGTGEERQESAGEAADFWPIAPAALRNYYREAERLLAVDDLPYDLLPFFERTRASAPALFAQLPELTAMLSKWAPFPRRNLASSLGSTLLASRNTSVYLNAQATELLLVPAGTQLAAVLVRTRSGSVFRFEAGEFVLAAGTVETSRLLLASRNVAPEGVGNAHDQVGRNFHDHLTVPAAALSGAARATLLAELGPWVFAREGGGANGLTVHSAKLAASSQLRERLGLNPMLAHLTIEEPAGSGLAAVRELLLALQRDGLRSGSVARCARIPGAALEALRLAWWARVHHRRFVSARAAVGLRLNTAQDTPSRSRITLSDELDSVGVPQPHVDWRITSHEMSGLRRFAVHLRERFAALQLDGIDWLPEIFDPDTPLSRIEDARHAMGGACMGRDSRTSVVSTDLAVHGIANLSIASAATFPTGSPPLPTLPLMALSLRLADRIARRLRR